MLEMTYFTRKNGNKHRSGRVRSTVIFVRHGHIVGRIEKPADKISPKEIVEMYSRCVASLAESIVVRCDAILL